MLLASIASFLLFLWLLKIRQSETKKLVRTKTQHEQFLILENNLKKTIFAKQTFEQELVEVASKLEEYQLELAKKEEKIRHLNEIGHSNLSNVQSSVKELERLSGAEVCKIFCVLLFTKLKYIRFYLLIRFTPVNPERL